MATTQDNSRNFRVLNTSPIRHDGLDKVTGRAQFGADFNMPGTLYGKILRSPHAHARILSIDTSKAEALPGGQGGGHSVGFSGYQPASRPVRSAVDAPSGGRERPCLR
ncbi:MAG: hypothetical protein QF878_14405 [SAR202 cluster bacterium]|nr:hypothetical protein [SAR202 cluster bacterium]MDP6716920.1 hypothetical protein [SAR202 cluster bacterium]